MDVLTTQRWYSLPRASTRSAYIQLLIFIAILLPSPLGNTISLAALNGITILLCTACICIFRIPIKVAYFGTLVALVWSCVIGFSTLVGNLENAIMRDAFDLHRPFLYTLCFAAAFSVKNAGPILRAIKFSLLAIVGIYIAQRFFISDVHYLYTRHVYVRAQAIFGNPYDFAYCLCLMQFYALSKTIRKISIFHAIAFALFSWLLIKTQSRTGILISLIGCTYLICLVGIAEKKLFRIFLVLTTLFSGAIYLIPHIEENYSYIYNGISGLFLKGVTKVGSSAKRLDDILRSIWAVDSLFVAFIGNGVAKYSDAGRLLESQYALYLNRYGVFGIFTLACVYGASALYSLKLYLKTITEENYNLGFSAIALHTWFVITPIAGFGNAFFDQPRISFLYFFCFGLVVHLNQSSKHIKANHEI